MFQERTKKLFALKKSEKNNQKHIQSLSKDLISEENYKKFKTQKSNHTNTESQTHQKMPSTVINGPNDNNIISINLNIFDTSICTDMTAMFRGCTSLVSIELNNFVISRATYIGQMFRGCSSLTSLDLSSFRGTNVQHMDNMFNGCSSLVHINLENFYYGNVIGMGRLFEGCISLVSLNLPNFNTQRVQYMDKLFYNCKIYNILIYQM